MSKTISEKHNTQHPHMMSNLSVSQMFIEDFEIQHGNVSLIIIIIKIIIIIIIRIRNNRKSSEEPTGGKEQ